MQGHSSANDALIPPIKQVMEFWIRNGLKRSSTVIYEQWVQRFLRDCARQGVSPSERLTATEVKGFAERYARRRHIPRGEAQGMAQRSLHAWSVGLGALGYQPVQWSAPVGTVESVAPPLAEYVAYRRVHSTAAEISIQRETTEIATWLAFLKLRRRTLRSVRLADIDAYLVKLRRRYAVATIARGLSSIRLFLRFLYCTGRLQHDLASSVQAPPRRRIEPPRALPWPEVQRLLRAVDRNTRTGRRDYAMLLLMSLYGLGSAEVIALKLEHVHWRDGTLTIHRPKTGVEIQLPLLPAAARALATYLREARPPDAPTRAFFVRRQFPHEAFTSSAIRFAIRKYAAKVGIGGRILGGHVLRHSHASRQVDQQAPPRVLSSILGHLDPESTSAYTRVAVERLRGIALPVPR